MKKSLSTWYQYNQQALFSELERLHQRLQNIVDNNGVDDDVTVPQDHQQQHHQKSTALDHVCDRLRLSNFERELLLLCVGVELDNEFSELCAKLHKDKKSAYPTFGLAFRVLNNPDWGALATQLPLRYFQLVTVAKGVALSAAPLKIAEGLLNFIIGHEHIDATLTALLEPMIDMIAPTASQQTIVEYIVQNWSKSDRQSHDLLINLIGTDKVSNKAVAHAVCQKLKVSLFKVNNDYLLDNKNSLVSLSRLLQRNRLLNDHIYWLDLDETQLQAKDRRLLIDFIKQTKALCFINSAENISANHFLKRVEIYKPTKQEQQRLWLHETKNYNSIMFTTAQLEQLTAQFSLNSMQIKNICLQSACHAEENASGIDYVDIWQACRQQLRTSVENLVHIIEPKADWHDLVLPEQQFKILEQLIAQIAQRHQVYQEWGFAEKSTRGQGISALFAGPSGTGKTLAAEILAKRLNLDLYHIDISAIVSKYIGETEKNLKKIFDIAEDSGAILLFDEADALFGKRSEVNDSHDRYANIETSYLLQRIENYSGLSILTTNFKENIDQAFMRRIRFVVQFPFPDTLQREKIWQHSFPEKLPQQQINFKQLSELNIAGGNIKNIALNAAFLAANGNKSLTMQHLQRATEDEYLKLELGLPEFNHYAKR